MDWNAIQQYLPLYQKAAVLTVRLGVAGIIFAIIIGLACAVIQYDKVPVLRQIVGVYIQLSRNTPLLVQLFFIYYGLPKVGIRTNAEICGIAGLAFLGGSYMAEAFRSGLEAIEPIQTESAYSLGMNRWQTMRYIILPQTLKIILPSLANQALNLVKNTSVLAMVAGLDLMYFADSWGSDRGYFAQAYFTCALLYFIICFPIARLARYLEARAKRLPVPKKRKGVA